MGIALSIEPLCHFDCFDDNQRIAGVIPLQLGINFPVDLLGFRRQLFSLFGAGDEQIAILISREDITARQAITTITHLYEVIDSLILQLVDASNEIVDVLDIPDPLEAVDEELLDDLLECGANPDGLRLLLAVEDEADEE